MLSTVAVLSDIHGVLPALAAVLAEPDVQAAERIVVTGDIAAGPQPVPVLDRLVSLGERVTLVRGNADRELVTLAGGGDTAIPDPIAAWAAAQLRSDQLELLAGLPHSITLPVDGFGDVLFCHATPRDDEEVVLVDSRLDRWQQVLAELPERVQTVVCGHTHTAGFSLRRWRTGSTTSCPPGPPTPRRWPPSARATGGEPARRRLQLLEHRGP